ncbi:MAG: glycerol-3-phosphate 1-O-acyltransferase PlsY [Acidimicrobiia bacterium]|nr:glycerol-3-phosphate 1-O-acyltransferase PlsY [Acidimicrobiia bacterium]
MQTLVAVVLAYLIGSIDFGVIVPRLMGKDIYAEGSGNPGTSNVFRTVGKKAAAVVLLGDSLKGLAAAAIGAAWISSPVGFACALAAVVGHCFPVWHRFQGGRGVATAVGAVLWLEPIWGLILAVGWGGVVATTKTASIASLAAMVLYVPGYLVFGTRGIGLLWAGATAGLVIARHAGNIRRIFAGSERSVTSS